MTRIATILSALLFAGCATLDGHYAPGCPMHAGDTITLDGGRFAWDKFTDVRTVGKDGKLETPYPNYPKTGNYTIDGDAVTFVPNSGEVLPTLYVVRAPDSVRLLTAAERQAWLASGRVPECALQRAADDDADDDRP